MRCSSGTIISNQSQLSVRPEAFQDITSNHRRSKPHL
uniref:Uncharacterized protein n=1 Tax=Arundo donax TaxID=35708 RepID=A0A0A9BZ62_ARUDO